MSQLEFLKTQIIETRNFVNRLISELPQDLWFIVPENTDSNFAWQIGHIMVSQNFHAITVITGRNKRVFELIPVGEYVKLFYGMGSSHRSVQKDIVTASKLKDQFDAVHEICLENLSGLTDEILQEKLQPIPFRHPVANIKYEALSWCFKHEMWHCAEMEDIKRHLNHPIKWLRD